VTVPGVLPRLVRLPREEAGFEFIFLGDIIGHFLEDLLPGARVRGFWRFRVTRNSELYIEEEEIPNLLEAVEEELHKRRRGAAVRLEIESDCPAELQRELAQRLRLSEEDVYLVKGPLQPMSLMMLRDLGPSPELCDEAFTSPVASFLRGREDLFAAIRERDILLHHPYESFGSVVAFLQQSANDLNVLAIKQTLYRTGRDERIATALMQAARNGKQVTAVVELKARFDEAANILWSRRLEEAGVHVVYGLVGYKIHSKMCLVVRREPDAIRRYLHLSTGNYNPDTAKIYTDIGLLTCRPEFGEDAADLFNMLTGICQFGGMRKFLVAPFELHRRMLELIAREADLARQGLPARIIAKMNALVDRDIIEALYQASQAGVRIDLLVRGICCLRPGLPGVSDRITVRSVVGRFLEHSRIYYFENACQPEVYIGSADWMPRNFFRRIETVFPIEDGVLRERMISELLALPLADNVKSRQLNSDGTYHRVTQAPGDPVCASQHQFISGSLVSGMTGSLERECVGEEPVVLQVRERPERR